MIIFIRHGQTTTNAQSLLVGRSDPSLTELGERQARALAPYLKGVHEVWVSPLARALSTAALALPHLTPVIREPFIEVDYGELDGQPLSALTAEQWRAHEHDHDVAFGGGESLASVDRRVHAELDALLADQSSLLHSTHEHLAIVSHVSPIKSATIWALGVSGSVTWRMRLNNGSLTTVATRSGVPSLVNFNVVPVLN
ncbi:MAG TPA: histidine phosphatase family protein [Acidimicrobiales bacterium]|nr:histidine phosphatase family protein [Acidimicrobiales bacterium]